MQSTFTRLVAFRCPLPLLEKVDAIAKAMHTSRTAVIIEALRLFMREIKARGGRVVPPYEGEELLGSIHFEPDKRGRRSKPFSPDDPACIALIGPPRKRRGSAKKRKKHVRRQRAGKEEALPAAQEALAAAERGDAAGA